VRLWIDTDLGGDPDDEIALWCAVRHPEVELAGVSTVHGDVVWRAGIARGLLAAAGAPAVPVVAGPPPPDLGGADALLAIGPWTHVAALERLPPRVALMGGTLGPVVHRGATVVVDWNVACDPSAAATVLRRPEPLLVVPLDATVPIDCDDAQRDEIARTVPVVAPWPDPLVLHDPAALLALLGEGAPRVERRELGGRVHDVVVAVDAQAVRATVLALCA
jgi:inosine-uridine nucleoside N-ribohydrolase